MVAPATYRLTPRMLQALESLLRDFHKLIDGDGAAGAQLEELIVKAINADTRAQHHVKWTEAGHDDKADIIVIVDNVTHELQIKRGKAGRMRGPDGEMTDCLKLSGHRLTRFNGEMKTITEYLNSSRYTIVSCAYKRVDTKETGRTHRYDLRYIPATMLGGWSETAWEHDAEKPKSPRTQTNANGVKARISPSMSWQIWWEIPLTGLTADRTFEIRN